MQVGWLNPRIDSKNLGDEIIEDAVQRELSSLLAEDVDLIGLPTQRILTRAERRRAANCDLFVVGGTNLLNGNIPRYIQWKLDPGLVATYSGKTILLGVGWWQYQRLNRLSSAIWRRLLVGQAHSVRDSYTAARLQGLGIDATNTGCPTMWALPDEIVFGPTSSKVISTVTDYHKNPERDLRMLRHLGENYEEVLVWLQGSKDKAYLDSLDMNVRFVDPTLAAFDGVLAQGDVDYFGTRLHAGVRALQHGVRSTVIAIDNRAAEIARDTGLPVVAEQFSANEVKNSTQSERVKLSLAHREIEAWKASLRSAVAAA